MNTFLRTLACWETYSKPEYSRQAEALYTVLAERIIPAFDGLDLDAEAHSDRIYQELSSRPSDGDSDPSDCAETAVDAGVEYFQFHDNARRAYINLTAVALYHLFEQQALSLLRNELSEIGRLRIERFVGVLNGYGIEIEILSSWAKIQELRFVCNAVKHGEGESATELKENRPELFIHPSRRNASEPEYPDPLNVDIPLSGYGIYVELKDIELYKDAIIQLWDEFLEKCKELARQNG